MPGRTLQGLSGVVSGEPTGVVEALDSSLLILDHDRVMKLLPVCLLDCEPAVRLLAAEYVDSADPVAQQLLAELRDDSLEDAKVRAAAGARLPSHAPPFLDRLDPGEAFDASSAAMAT